MKDRIPKTRAFLNEVLRIASVDEYTATIFNIITMTLVDNHHIYGPVQSTIMQFIWEMELELKLFGLAKQLSDLNAWRKTASLSSSHNSQVLPLE